MTRSTRRALAGCHKARTGTTARRQCSAGHDETERAGQLARDAVAMTNRRGGDVVIPGLVLAHHPGMAEEN
ncbi:hypothetical protein [Bradyrhizobium sp.]|uniref:hypothetical protein n=1 Tax=Bradyrhizobium sp. TaxID=376 RepID=UPI003C1B7CDC